MGNSERPIEAALWTPSRPIIVFPSSPASDTAQPKQSGESSGWTRIALTNPASAEDLAAVGPALRLQWRLCDSLTLIPGSDGNAVMVYRSDGKQLDSGAQDHVRALIASAQFSAKRRAEQQADVQRQREQIESRRQRPGGQWNRSINGEGLSMASKHLQQLVRREAANEKLEAVRRADKAAQLATVKRAKPDPRAKAPNRSPRVER